MDKIMRVYMPILMLVLWATITINHFSRDLNWIPLLFLFPPLIMLVIMSIKEQREIEKG
tara:strand:- start:1731 stop:1907 length:177 start_codon:yes stop_codon:yes gene_type:complete